MTVSGSQPSQYVELMELRKAALQQGQEQLAAELLDAAEGLVAAGLVSSHELKAGAYI